LPNDLDVYVHNLDDYVHRPPGLYTPLDWYWGPNADGKFFASVRQVLVSEDDADFATWRGRQGHGAAGWPLDDAGAKNPASLQTEIGRYGLYADPSLKLPRATVSALLDALSASQRTTITTDHMARLVARAATGPVVLGDPKVGRAAADIGITPDAWFTLAGA